METTIVSQFVSQFKTALTFKNGRHHYYGNLKIDNDVAIWDNVVIHGDLVVAGNLTSHEKLIVVGNIQVGGDFIAGRNVMANNIKVEKMFGCYGSVRTKNLEAGWFWVDGNLFASDVSAQDTSTVHGWMKASTVHGEVLVDIEI